MNTPRTCIACHAERLGEPVTAGDCLGFAACETCTKLSKPSEMDAVKAWSKWLSELHKRIGRKQKKQPGEM